MATALKLYTADQNNNLITKTVGNANPAASNYVLKTFSEKVTELTDNSFLKVERIDTTDITNATNE